MDIEFHYYTNYIIALAAGFSNEAAYKIAYSAQLLDDNTTKYTITLSNGMTYTNEISQTFNITMPVKELYQIYRCFHFVPGDNPHTPYQTTPNCSRAKNMLIKALESLNPYFIGIASHAYSDTWAHQNFSGMYDNNNAVIGFPEIFIPNIGHADFGEQPDIVGLIWNDSRYNRQVDNSIRFIEAAQHIYNIYRHFLSNQSISAINDWDELEKMLIYCFGISSISQFTANKHRQHRINKYKEVGQEEFKIDIIDYIGDDWLNNNKLGNWIAFQEGVKYFLNRLNGFTDT